MLLTCAVLEVVSQRLTSLRWGTTTDQDGREGGREVAEEGRESGAVVVVVVVSVVVVVEEELE